MSEGVFSDTDLNFTSDGISTNAKITASLNMLTLTGNTGSNDIILRGILDPVNQNDAATLDFIDKTITWKNPVTAATTSPGTLATDFENGDTIDGHVIATGNRILIKDQASASENGIYTVNVTGAPTRTTDAETGTTCTSTAVIISNGTANADKIFICTTNSANFGDSIAFAEIIGQATPGGVDTNVQYNNSGTLDGASNFTWDDTNQLVTITGKETIATTTSLTGTPGLTGSQLEIQAQTFTDNSGGPTTTNAIFHSIAQPTLAATATTTTTNASTFYVAGPPIAGTNETITNAYSMWIDSGDLQVDERVLADGNIISNATVTGVSLTDGTATLNSGNWTNVTSLTATTITGTTINDGTATLSAGTLTGLLTPTSDTEAANKAYVDAIASGLEWKNPVRVTTTAVLSALSAEQTIDGVSTTSGDRVLVKNGTTTNPNIGGASIDNGIYVVAVGAWARSSDMAIGAPASQDAMFIQEGILFASAGFVCTNISPNDIVDTDDLIFVQFTGAGQIIAGSGLGKTGNTLFVNVDDTTIEIVSDALQVKDGSIDTTKLATNAVTTIKITDGDVTNAKLANSSLTVTAGNGLQNGGLVSLGSSITIDVDSTVLRTTGDQSASGVQSFTNTTQSTDSTTGAVVISGGLGIQKDLFSIGRIDTTDVIEGGTLTDGTLSINLGSITGASSIGTGSLTATGTVQGDTFTDGTSSLTAGVWTSVVSLTASGALSGGSITDGIATLSSGTLSGLVTPTADSHAANKAYVDSAVQGLIWQDPCRVGTTGSNITLFGSAPDTLDGVSLVALDRILVKDQTSAIQNGIYEVTTLGTGANGTWDRVTEMDTGVDAENFATLVEEGTVNSGASFTVTGVSPFTIDTSDIVWTQFSSSGTVSAGDGLTKVGNTLNVNVDDVTIEIALDDLQVKASGISATQLATNAVTTVKITDANVSNAKLQNSSLTVTAGDGLQTGGIVSLGGSVTLDVDTTVLRTTGNQSAAGIQSFTNTTQSTDSITGAVIISGGVGIAKDLFSVGRIDTTGIIEGGTLTDGTLSSTAGVVTGGVSIATGSLTGTGTVQGGTISDGAGATLTGGDLVAVDGTFSTDLTLSARPPTEVLFATTGGLVTSDPNFRWDGSLLAALTFETQTITRPNDPNLASLWSDGTGNIDIGLNTTGTIQLGLGPTLELTQSSSTLQSELTIQDNFSRQYTESVINTVGNTTYTANQMFNGLILRDPNGANRIDVTATAAELVATIPNSVVGSSMEIIIRNTADALELITINGGTGVTINDTVTIQNGITSRFLMVLTNVTLGLEAATLYISVPRDRVVLQASLSDPTSGGTVTRWANWGPTVSVTVVDGLVTGYSGKIVQLVAAYSNNTPLRLNDVTDFLRFSLGTSNATLDVFTPYTGGTNVIEWSNSDDNTYPNTSSGLLDIVITSTDKLAIQSVEAGSVTPTSGTEIRFAVTVELD